jgi:prepilin-type N-terminal cleavage/methylation domain-containing protein
MDRSRRQPLRARANTRGLTLIEVLIVVALIAL